MKTRKPKKRLLPPLAGKNNPCMNCPPIVPVLKMNRGIGVGFGYAAVECNGEPVWMEDSHNWEDCWTVRKAENAARKKPRSDWRIVLHGPMHGETYQRQGKGRWVLVEKNEGFA